MCLLCYDVHDVKYTILKAYDGLRLVTTFRRLDRFFEIRAMVSRRELFTALQPYLSLEALKFCFSLCELFSR